MYYKYNRSSKRIAIGRMRYEHINVPERYFIFFYRHASSNLDNFDIGMQIIT